MADEHDRAALYIPGQQRADIMTELIAAAARHGYPIVDVVWRWDDLVRVLAARDADIGLIRSHADLPAGRRPRLVALDELPVSHRRPRWRR